MRTLSVFLFITVLLSFGAGLAHAETPPQRVLIIGDSMMRVTAHSLELQLARQPGVESRAFTSLGSGLARLDIYDWMEQADELVAEFNPDLTIAWFGTNDHQPMRTNDGIIRPMTPEWSAEYGRRVGALMDKLTAAEGARIIWLELPDMRDANLQADVTLINELLKQEAASRPAATFYPTISLFSRRPGTFSMHIPGPTGMPLSVRDADGVHLNRAGADRIAEQLIGHLYGDTARAR
jgi:uncharacterized protein